jgi:UDP:flavonoid glycosyltransferase YjiC (YdhE family)
VYGVRRDLTEDLPDGDLVYRPFSETVFLDDLRTARAVIAGGGFSLLSECVYLHKPVLSIPVEGQFEQVLNARYLEKLGYGEYAPDPTPQAIRAFLDRLPAHERALAAYRQDGNSEALAALREQLSLVALERAGTRRGRRALTAAATAADTLAADDTRSGARGPKESAATDPARQTDGGPP